MKVTIDLPDEYEYEVTGAVPDKYEYDTDLPLTRPESSFVMTRDLSGKVLSRYGCNVWDYIAYNMAENSKINFDKHIPHEYVDDAKWLMFILDRVVTGQGKNGNNFAVSTLKKHLSSVVKPLCSYAKSKQISILDVLDNEEHMAILIQLNVGFNAFNVTIVTFINLFNALGQDKLGFVINVNDLVLAKVREICAVVCNAIQQTPIIPPRLYGNVINQAWDVIAEYEKIEDDILGYFNALTNLPARKAQKTPSVIESRNICEALAPFLKSNAIANVMKKHGLRGKNEVNPQTISVYLNCVRNACKDLIHIYSGMRDNEAYNLPDQCYGKDPHKKRKHARLLGHTFKYTGYKSKGSWVTTSDIERVINTLNKQNAIIIKSAISKHNLNFDVTSEVTQEPCPLFISTGYLTGSSPDVPEKKIKIKKASRVPKRNGGYNALYDIDQFRITEKDLAFLQRFEPERDWELDGFNVGKLWRFTSHQFRRSLAVYSRQSGLVSIGSVQTQLHHLFVETSYYYANNAENCTFDTTDKDHMAKEFTKNIAAADFAAFIFDIMFSEEPLHGVKGKVYERTIRQVDDKLTWITENRKETEKKFNKGLIAHSDTPLGSCSSTSPCTEKLTRNFTGCIGCDGASLKLSKIERTIEVLEVFIETLNPASVEYRSEKEYLEQLIELKNKVA